MALENEIDVNFYNLIHQQVGSVVSDRISDRRDKRRQPFAAFQRIAVRRGERVPDESEFVPVRCNDLTRNGFSFFLPTQPDFHSLVAAFGNPSEVIYVAAEVSHYSDVLLYSSGVVQPIDDSGADVDDRDPSGGTATPMVLVGCRFTERLHKHQ